MRRAIEDANEVAGITAAKESAKGAAERLILALVNGTLADVALAAERAYLPIGRLAAMAKSAPPPA
jgi:hypothetical protein